MEIGWVFLAIVMADGKRFVLQGEGCPHKSVRVVNAAGMEMCTGIRFHALIFNFISDPTHVGLGGNEAVAPS
jgi:hypothetical protein